MGAGVRRRPRLRWVTEEPTRRELRGYSRVMFQDVQRAVAIADATQPTERGLQPLVSFDRWFPAGGRVAVLGVPVRTFDDLRVVTRFVLDPAYRRGCDLLLWTDVAADDVPDHLEDPDRGFGWTLDRFRYLIDRYEERHVDDGLPPLTPIEARLLHAMRALDLRPFVQFGVGPFRVDFAFPDRRLAVEADGREWHDAIRDKARDEALNDLGWDVMHFTGSHIHRNAEDCAAAVAQYLSQLEPAPVYSQPLQARRGWWERLLAWLFPSRTVAAEERGEYVVEPESPGSGDLDPEQRAAVNASDGVTQVIAPAGSGKTTVLVERVGELLSRGVAPHRILCTTFNRAARDELKERLGRAGVPPTVDVETFHSLGRRILSQDDQLPRDHVELSWGELRKIAGAVAQAPDATFLDAAEAKEWVSYFKLVLMKTAAELTDPPGSPVELTARGIYERYEREMQRRDAWDFDDLIFLSIRYLRADAEARRRWQDRWRCVLVDEYQDIEPAQELLVQTVAAPHDCVFVVGDEDQCIYAWRRASVERIVQLDQTLPTLERVILQTNYRSGSDIVAAADRLVRHNQIRFPKQIGAGRDVPGEIHCEGFADDTAAIASAMEVIKSHEPMSIGVLARTSAQLRELAMACVDADIPITASEKILRPSRAEQVVLSYLLVCHKPEQAGPDDVEQMFRYPNRYLPKRYAGTILQQRRNGRTFVSTVGDLPRMDDWRIAALTGAAPHLDALAAAGDGSQAIALLRDDLGLDRHFTSRDQLSPTDNDDRDALDSLETMAGGRSLDGLIETLLDRRQTLETLKSSDGVELTTIHGAKGREWPVVVLVGADDKTMPHRRAIGDADDAESLQRVWEDERRLAYVGLTRARDVLHVQWVSDSSPFLTEAGIVAGERKAAPARSADRRDTPGRQGPRVQAGPPPRPQSPGRASSSPSGRTVTARYPGTCQVCRSPIAEGSPIVRRDERWVHARCG